MPLNIDILQILLHMLNFVILAGGLTFLLFRPVNKFLTQRKEHFEHMSRETEEEKKKSEELKFEYEERLKRADEEIGTMRTDAEREMASVSRKYIDEAREKAKAIVTAAEQEAEARKEHILDSAQTEIGELVITAAQRLLNDTVTPERNSALYDEFIRLADRSVADERKKQ